MRKRLRKKLRVEEFKEYGFEVSFNGPSVDRAKELFDDFFTFVESRDLIIGGGWGGGAFFYVSKLARNSATEDDRQAVLSWLQSKPEISEVCVAPLSDAWHGWD